MSLGSDLEQLARASVTDLERVANSIHDVIRRYRDDSQSPLRGRSFDPTGVHAHGGDPTGDTALAWHEDGLQRLFGEWCNLNREIGRKSYRLWQVTQQLKGLDSATAKELNQREHEQTGRCIDCGRVVARTKADPLVAGRCQADYKKHQRARAALITTTTVPPEGTSTNGARP